VHYPIYCLVCFANDLIAKLTDKSTDSDVVSHELATDIVDEVCEELSDRTD
jgi:hypothetical protein